MMTSMATAVTGRVQGWSRRALVTAGLAIVVADAGYAQSAGGPPFSRPASEPDEVALALSALPESMRAAATVFALGAKGYRQVRTGTNGVSCLVEQSRPDTQEPICWDREGSETILPVVLDRAAWRAEGIEESDIERRVQERFANGTYRAPRRPGVSYMLSAHNYVFNGERVVHFFPHVMFYAPYMTNADIGTDGTDPFAPWILNEGSPHAYMIVVTRPRSDSR